MKKNLIIVSAGKLGREVYTWACQAIAAGGLWTFKGFLDDRSNALADFKYDVPVLGTLADYEPGEGDEFLCAIGDPATRKDHVLAIQAKGGKLATLIHPSAIVGQNVEIGPGSIICPLTHLSCDIQLGTAVFFGTHSNTGHDTVLGDFCQISGSCEINGNANLGEGVFLGSHATILPNARLGEWSYVGAHSVVLKRVRPYEKVFGIPAVSIGTTAADPGTSRDGG